MKLHEVILIPLQPEDREQFILDNQWAFKYGAQQEFGMRDERCGFHIVEFWNKHHHGPAVPEEESGHWSEDDEMFVFRKEMTTRGI